MDFKHKLTEKIKATYQKSTSDSEYTTFLKHFGEFTVAKLDKKEVSGQEYILEELRGIRMRLDRADSLRKSDLERPIGRARVRRDIDICLSSRSEAEIERMLKIAGNHSALSSIALQRRGSHKHLVGDLKPDVNGDAKEITLLIKSGASPQKDIAAELQ